MAACPTDRRSRRLCRHRPPDSAQGSCQQKSGELTPRHLVVFNMSNKCRCWQLLVTSEFPRIALRRSREGSAGPNKGRAGLVFSDQERDPDFRVNAYKCRTRLTRNSVKVGRRAARPAWGKNSRTLLAGHAGRSHPHRRPERGKLKSRKLCSTTALQLCPANSFKNVRRSRKEFPICWHTGAGRDLHGITAAESNIEREPLELNGKTRSGRHWSSSDSLRLLRTVLIPSHPRVGG